MDTSDSANQTTQIDALVDVFIEQFHTDSPLRAEDLVDAHPELGEALAAHLAAAEDLLAQSDPTKLVTEPASDSEVVLSGGAQTIPGYRITRELHRGGQGVVYQAVQVSTRRDVAIKVLHGGAFAGLRDRARFEREVLILSRLSHPNIVTVHDSGSAAGGFYFVMDYIRGTPLDQYLENTRALRSQGVQTSRRQNVSGLLRLFAKICDAVNVAHLRGIIHRDLKPSNIRVDPSGEPHVLDFGLAKVGKFDELADSRSEVQTIRGQFVGSIAWASPEQAEGRADDTDIRTDVYSLGVMLYHALTGRFPYEVTGSLADVLNRIRHDEPPRPGGLAAGLDHEIDALVLKCLSKEPDRRYQSAGELGRDLHRYLRGEPIEAKRDSSWYVLRKSLRRYRVAVAVAFGFLTVVTAGLVFSVTYWRQAVVARREVEVERNNAVRQASIAEAVNAFLNEDLLSAADPELSANHNMTVREALDAASARVEGRFDDEPLVEAAVRTTLGYAYLNLGEYDTCEPHLTRAHELRNRELGSEHALTLRALNNLGSLHAAQGRLSEAESEFRTVISRRKQLLGEDHPESLAAMNNLAELLGDLGRYDEAEALHVDVIERRLRVLGENHEDTATSLNNLAVIYMKQHRHPDAIPLLNHALEIRRHVFGGDHLRTLGTLYNLASCHFGLNLHDQAEMLYQEGLASCESSLGPEHPLTLRFSHSLGVCYLDLEQFGPAEQHLKRAAEARKRVLGEEHPDTLFSLNQLATVYHAQDRREEAVIILADSYQKALRGMGDSHPITVSIMNTLGVLYKQMGRLEEAEPLYRKALEVRRQRFGDQHVGVLVPMSNLGSLYLDLGRYEEAEELFAAASALAKQVLEKGHWHSGWFLVKHGNALTLLERYEQAEESLLSGYAILDAAFENDDERLTEAAKFVVFLYEQWGKPDKADQWRAEEAPSTQVTS